MTLAMTLPGLADEPAPIATAAEPGAALRELFGHPAFRPGQHEAVQAALADRDALVVMPTGAGKSLCYQLPALMRGDLTVVVSPLVSLMADQVRSLAAVAPGRVAMVNGQQDTRRNRAALEAAAAGRLRLLYVAPERFAAPGFLDRLAGAAVGLFVVDEAHCVSHWGHDFRPDYLRLADAARRLGARALMASTATATAHVAADIAARLGLADPVRISTGFDRPNLSYAVVPCPSKETAHCGIVAALADPAARPAIVYTGTRTECERLARRIERELDVAVAAYHAGMPRAARGEAQRQFMADVAPIVVATNAFGMGVDKPDVRTVCHEAVPASLEAYYQEAGRAGRDGLPARALLFACGRDKGLHRHFIDRAAIADEAFAAVAERLLVDAPRSRVAGGAAAHVAAPEAATPDTAPRRAAGQSFTTAAPAPHTAIRFDCALADLAAAAAVEEDIARAVVGHLARAGVIEPAPSAPDRVAGRVAGAWDRAALEACRAAAAAADDARRRQYRSVWGYVESSGCRRAAILRHFGDAAAPAPAGACCDACEPALRPATPEAARSRGGLRRIAPQPPLATAPDAGLDDAVLEIVALARPPLGRRRVVEVLRGGRSRELRRHAYDGLPHYGAFAEVKPDQVLARVDALVEAGALRCRGGGHPTLEVA